MPSKSELEEVIREIVDDVCRSWRFDDEAEPISSLADRELCLGRCYDRLASMGVEA